MEEKANKSLLIVIGITIAIISLCAILFGSPLAYAAVHISPATNVTKLSAAETDAIKGLKIIVDNRGITPPTDSISAERAVATAAEIAGRSYGLTFTGRVFVGLYEYDTHGSNAPYWVVEAQTAAEGFQCTINAATGVDERGLLLPADIDWSWFDSWSQKATDDWRMNFEKSFQKENKTAEELSAQLRPSTPEEIEAKRQELNAFAAAKADLPHSAKAIEFVNSSDFGNGAKAVSAKIIADITYDTNPAYMVEVKLDNGKYIILSLLESPEKCFAYDRIDADFAQTYPGLQAR